LNIASFEANKRCGPLSMGVASNLKQVAILLLDLAPVDQGGRIGQADAATTGPGGGVILGSLMTMIGGTWYAFARADMNRRRRWHSVENRG
jgi:hypothetical protein